MINSSTDTPITYREQIALLLQANMFWKIIIYFGGASFLLMFVFGFAFQIMFSGLCLGLFRLGLIFDPAYKLLVRVLRLKGVPAHLAKPPVWFSVYSAILFLFPLVIILIGGFFLYKAGFCAQNMACLLLFIVKR